MRFLAFNSSLTRSMAALVLSLALLGGCETNPPAPSASTASQSAPASVAAVPLMAIVSAQTNPVKSNLEFIDLQGAGNVILGSSLLHLSNNGDYALSGIISGGGGSVEPLPADKKRD